MVEEHLQSQSEKKLEHIGRLEQLIQSEFQQAATAYMFKDMKKSKEALSLRYLHQSKLAKLKGVQPPERYVDPEEFFSRWDWHRGCLKPPKIDNDSEGPDHNSLVPRRPLSPFGGREIALPLPKTIDKDD